MLCLRCSRENPDHNRYCGFCNAVLPVLWATETPSTQIELEEGRNYDQPDRCYPNGALEALREALENFRARRADDLPVLDCADLLQARFDGLMVEVPKMLQAVRDHLRLERDDEVGHRLAYLIKFGSQIFTDGMAKLDQYLDGEGGSVEAILEELQTGNDYICHTAYLVEEMLSREASV